MNAVFLDIETTGRNPQRHQIYEFAMVPVIANIIRRDLAWHVLLQHKTWKIENDILAHVANRIANPKPGVPWIPSNSWGHLFKNKIYQWFPNPKKIVLGGKNIGGFDIQFMKKLDPSLEYDSELFSYSYLDVGNYYIETDDDRIPHLEECARRAKLDGAPITRENSHYADDDAFLSAELYCWHMYDRIMYGEDHDGTIRIFPAQPVKEPEDDGGLVDEETAIAG